MLSVFTRMRAYPPTHTHTESHYVVLAGIEINTDLPASVSLTLGLKVCDTSLSFVSRLLEPSLAD